MSEALQSLLCPEDGTWQETPGLTQNLPSGKTSALGSRGLGWTSHRHASCVAELKVCLLPKEETYPLQCLVRACEGTVQQQPAPNFQCPKVKDVCFLSTSQAQCTWGRGLCSLPSLGDPGDGGREAREGHRAHHTLALQAPAQERPTSLLPTSLLLTLPPPKPVAPPPATSTRRGK